MSIHPLKPEGLAADFGLGAESAHTSVISGLFRDALSTLRPPVTPPATPAGAGDVLAHVPQSFSPAPPVKADPAPDQNGRDISLSGGFPAASTPGSPPVHPTVVAVEKESPQPQDSLPTAGGHHPGDAGSHEFGEPYFYTNELSKSTERHRSPEPAWSSLPTSGSPYYFIEEFSKALPATGAVDAPQALPVPSFDIEGVRRDFPALHQQVHGHRLVWLDNAATTHKPQSVIDATSRFYSLDNSNIHRAAHTLAARSTEHFETGRDKVRDFLGARSSKEIVFVRGTTEAINLVAQSWGRANVGPGDEIIVSQLEHHANIVPWQLLASQVGATIRVIPINDRGELLIEELPRLLNDRTKIVAVTHVSNALGTINPVQEIIAIAHSFGVPVLVDGAQSTPHIPINVTALDADFLVFSGHKVFGPTGIGALYAKSHILESMPPWQGGGHMIRDVSFEKTIYQDAPEKFEAGTPDIAGVVGLSAALSYMMNQGIPALAAYEHSLLEYAEEALRSVRGIRQIGTAAQKASVFGFVVPGTANEVIARELDRRGIAVRAGHHCAMPAVRHFGIEGSIRPSVAFYNTREEIDTFIRALHQIVRA